MTLLVIHCLIFSSVCAVTVVLSNRLQSNEFTKSDLYATNNALLSNKMLKSRPECILFCVKIKACSMVAIRQTNGEQSNVCNMYAIYNSNNFTRAQPDIEILYKQGGQTQMLTAPQTTNVPIIQAIITHPETTQAETTQSETTPAEVEVEMVQGETTGSGQSETTQATQAETTQAQTTQAETTASGPTCYNPFTSVAGGCFYSRNTAVSREDAETECHGLTPRSELAVFTDADVSPHTDPLVQQPCPIYMAKWEIIAKEFLTVA